MFETIKTVLALALLTALLGAGGMWIVGGGDGHFEHEGIQRISRPGEQVFKWMTKPDLRRQWVGGLVATTKNTPGDIDAGTKLVEEYDTGDGRARHKIEVTGYELDKLYSYKVTSDDYELDVTYRLGALHTGKKSRVDYRMEIQLTGGWFDNLLEPILANRVLAKIEGDLEALTTVVESQQY